jgi:hypothetical protein
MLYILTANDTTDPLEFGGTPNKLIKSFNSLNVEASGLNLSNFRSLGLKKFIWRITRLISGKSPLGWQFSNRCSNLRNNLIAVSTDKQDYIISFFQLNYPKNRHYSLYIDCSLSYLFQNYREVFMVASDIKVSAVERERVVYNQAHMIFVKTELCKSDLVSNYKIPDNKVYILNPPPNVELNLDLKVKESRLASLNDGLRMLFIGKDARRKGLTNTLELAFLIASSGIKVQLDVVGIEKFHNTPKNSNLKINYHGFLNPTSTKLESLISEAHLGLLLSETEAAGISVIEFQYHGIVPVVSEVVMKNFLIKTSNFFLLIDQDVESLSRKLIESYKSGNLSLLLAEAWNDRHHILRGVDVANEINRVIKGSEL